MKPSTGNDVGQSREGRWLKPLVRKLRDWLDGYLQEDARSVGDGSTAREEVPNESFSARHDVGEEFGPASALGDQARALPPEPFRTPGPPEDWLARVREGAPELLMPMEEGGTPRQSASGTAMNGERSQVQWASAERNLRRPSGQTSVESPGAPERRRTPINPAFAASPQPTWFQRLTRRLADRISGSLGVRGRRSEKEYVGPPEHAAASGRTNIQRPDDAASRQPETTSIHESVAAARYEAGLRRERLSDVRGNLDRDDSSARTIHTKDGNFASALLDEQRESGRFFPSLPGEREGRGRPTKADNASSVSSLEELRPRRPSVGHHQAPWPAWPQRHEPGPSMARHAGKDSNRPATSMPMNPELVPDTADLTRRPLRVNVPSSIPPTSRFSEVMGPRDPWPELPEESFSSADDEAQLFRKWERLQSLDLEQRGGR